MNFLCKSIGEGEWVRMGANFLSLKKNPLKRILISVTNDLTSDNRVHRVCLTLHGMGFRILLVGRKLPASPPLSGRPYATRRMRLFCRKGPLFYAAYNIRLFLFLLFRRFDLLLANDLDTLPANRLAGWLRGKPVIYDSHEYFTEVPELVNRPRVKKIWEWLERRLVPGVAAAYTVSESIAKAYTRTYKIPFAVVRNLPMASPAPFFPGPQRDTRSHSASEEDKESCAPCGGNVAPESIPEEDRNSSGSGDDRKVIVYQGALNLGRGLENAIRAMQYLPEALLLLAGCGDRETELKLLASRLKLPNVRFPGRIAPEELVNWTRQAHLGISLEEDLGLNYRYALPNKLFDYIQARVPVVVSPLPEMSRIVSYYHIGLIAPSADPEVLAATFREALTQGEQRKEWLTNLERAARELTWENEEHKIRGIFEQFLHPGAG